MNTRIIIFTGIVATDIILTSKENGINGFWSTFGASLIVATLIWFGDIWNIMLPTGVLSVKHPIVTQETPRIVLALFGWIIMAVMTLFALFG
jgi:hypothetical protein